MKRKEKKVKGKRKVESVQRVGEDDITFRVSRYLLHVLIEDEEAVRRAVSRRRGEREWVLARVREHEHEHEHENRRREEKRRDEKRGEERRGEKKKKKRRRKKKKREKERAQAHAATSSSSHGYFRALLTSGPPRPAQRAQSTQLQFLALASTCFM